MGKFKIERNFLFGKEAKFTFWGRKGCSHGMYNIYSYDYYVYGIKGLFNYTKKVSW